MKHKFYRLGTFMVVGIFALTLFGTVAEAKSMIDKGDLGKYQRDGRVVHRVFTASPDTGSAGQKAAAETSRQVRYDKGERGTWVREGRQVRKESGSTANHRASRQKHHESKYRIVDHRKHIHRYPS